MIENILADFNINSKVISTERYGNGIINETYLVRTCGNGSKVKYILRKINSYVFSNPAIVVDNTVKTIQHISNKLQKQDNKKISDYVFQIVETKDGNYYKTDDDNNYWCLLTFIENSYTIEIVENKEQAYQAAKTFGRFQRLLFDADINDFQPTIPNFHNLKNRLLTFEKAIKDDIVQRVKTAEEELLRINTYKYLQKEFSNILNETKLPKRITHNDAKINNVLLNKLTDKGQCVIDLDTVMPGYILYDFGDMVRSFTNPKPEDIQDINKVTMRIEIFESLAKGYLEELGGLLTKSEIKYLTLGAVLITLEQSIRYLTDYLIGDKYYTINFSNQNLIRARTQLKLLDSIIEQKEEMRKIVEKTVEFYTKEL